MLNLNGVAIRGFDWDRGNFQKCQSRGVNSRDIERMFEGTVKILPAKSPEGRFLAIGEGEDGRGLLVVFEIVRKRKPRGLGFYIRPISVRHMHEEEVRHREKQAYNKRAKGKGKPDPQKPR